MFRCRKTCNEEKLVEGVSQVITESHQPRNNKNRRIVRIVKIMEDGIHIEKALASKTLRVPWAKIAEINKSKEVRNALEIKMRDGKYVTFSIYNSYKYQQIMEFMAKYIADKCNERN